MLCPHHVTTRRWATSPEERTSLWAARHSAYWAAIALRPGCKGFPTDVCVPVSQLPRCILESTAEAQQLGLLAPLVSSKWWQMVDYGGTP